MVDSSQKTPVRLHLLDVDFRREADMGSLFAALDPPADTLDNLSLAAQRSPDSLDRRLQAWGYAGDPYGQFRRTGQLTSLGVYGDWTYFEDDERFMPLIARFVMDGSRIVFERSKTTGDPDFWDQDHEAWVFAAGAVSLRSADREIEWWIR